jgi:DEAD/DEAH box helicase domain-containing protein
MKEQFPKPPSLCVRATGTIREYLEAMRASARFGPQVVHVEEIRGNTAIYGQVETPWRQGMDRVLAALSINGLFTHQAAAINHIRAGRSVVTATQTASGKSLIYNLPVFEHMLAHPADHALYLFPLKALAQDQLRTIDSMRAGLPTGQDVSAAIYDGDTSAYTRKKIRELPPNILISNPDILHLSLLGYHDSWAPFWSRLRFVVLDEIHTYRGVFGSHMAWIIRRLKRICRHYGSSPAFILSSATIGNPAQFTRELVGQQVHCVTDSGAPQGDKSFVFFDPADSPAHAASQLLEAALKRGLRAIVYTQSRKMTELVSLYTSAKLGDLRGKLTAYRAGFLPGERREIEAKLSSGELLGVVSTSALELGIDIGELEICILVGYPGSVMATWQRSGRVGRRQADSLVVLVAQEDALDKHFMANPADFFGREVEAAVINPDNSEIVKRHLACAAAELPIGKPDPIIAGKSARAALNDLLRSGQLLAGEKGDCFYSTLKYPQRHVDIRGGGASFVIVDKATDELLGHVDGGRCFKECHPGAVFLQKGRTLLVEQLDVEGSRIGVREKKIHYFTRVLSQKSTEVLEVYASKSGSNYRVCFGSLRVTDRVTGYERRLTAGQRLLGSHALDLPPNIFETEGLWLEIPTNVQDKFQKEQRHFMGGIHALEHAAIGIFPLLVLCDRNDIGGLSTTYHPQTGGAAVFIYDGHAGGIGLSRQAYEHIDVLLEDTYQAIKACTCETGCPSCVHSPKCGSGNRPIDKQAARILLEELLSATGSGLPIKSHQNIGDLSKGPRQLSSQATKLALPRHYVVFDLETQRSAAEVGGWHRADQMGISVGVVYDSQADGFFTYLEADIDQLVEHLHSPELVVGFNNKRFDNTVLSAYTSKDLSRLNTLDILEVVKKRLGYRLSLDRLAEQTLGVSKSADGLLALQWYKQGRIDKIINYCRSDVAITRDLLLFGFEKGYLLFKNKAGQVVRCPFYIGLAEAEKV